MITIREARKEKGYTQEEVARAAGVTLRYYSRIEKGESTPTVTVAIKICSFLDRNAHDIEWNEKADLN